ncbi:MAG: hypothetical protein QNJ54_33220 [Prochloraceae cyanobacterium]|nr:hypothetical protein [Prochloraceae cyanobacterium]
MSTPKARDSSPGLPFANAKERKEVQSLIRRKVFERMERAKALREFSQISEYRFWQEEFADGFVCSYGERQILQVYRLEDGGIGINISEEISELPEEIVTILFKSGALIKAASDSFAEIYYRVNGFLPAGEDIQNVTTIEKKS